MKSEIIKYSSTWNIEALRRRDRVVCITCDNWSDYCHCKEPKLTKMSIIYDILYIDTRRTGIFYVNGHDK